MNEEKNIETPQDGDAERTEEINISPADTGTFIVGKGQETRNSKTGTANMEVHHHPHVPKCRMLMH